MADRTNYMKTLSEVLESLRLKRWDNEFIMDDIYFTTTNGNKYLPDQLTIIKTYRFEGESNPSDSSILYLIEANDKMIGYTIDAYGVYSNHNLEYDNFIRSIPIKDRELQLLFTLD